MPGNAGWPIRCIEEMNSPCSAPFGGLRRRRRWPATKGRVALQGHGPGVHATRRAGDDRQHGHRWVQARLHEAQFVLDINADRFGAPEILVLPLPAALAWQRASASASLSTRPKRNVQSCARRRPPSLKARAARPNGTRQRIRRSRGSAVRESPCSVTARTTRRALGRGARSPGHRASRSRRRRRSGAQLQAGSLCRPQMRATLATASGAGRSARPRAGDDALAHLLGAFPGQAPVHKKRRRVAPAPNLGDNNAGIPAPSHRGPSRGRSGVPPVAIKSCDGPPCRCCGSCRWTSRPAWPGPGQCRCPARTATRSCC